MEMFSILNTCNKIKDEAEHVTGVFRQLVRLHLMTTSYVLLEDCFNCLNNKTIYLTDMKITTRRSGPINTTSLSDWSQVRCHFNTSLGENTRTLFQKAAYLYSCLTVFKLQILNNIK